LEAEDVVQDSFLRLVSAAEVRDREGFLVRVVIRLCLDRLGSARMRREAYVGPWLPEPVLTGAQATGPADPSPVSTAHPTSRGISTGSLSSVAGRRESAIRVHDTRRTCASLLVALDVHPRVAMQILRHFSGDPILCGVSRLGLVDRGGCQTFCVLCSV